MSCEREKMRKQRVDPGCSVWKLQMLGEPPPPTIPPTKHAKEFGGEQRPFPSCTAVLALGGADSRARRAGKEHCRS